MKDGLGKVLLAKHDTLARGQVKSFLAGGVEGAIEVSPGPEKSAGSTGRTRGSVKPSTGQPNIADPGIRNAYPIANEKDVEYAVKRWDPYDPAFIAVGTHYFRFIRERYPIIDTATERARERLEQEQSANVRRANNAC